jgi:hypothetical protein
VGDELIAHYRAACGQPDVVLPDLAAGPAKFPRDSIPVQRRQSVP